MPLVGERSEAGLDVFPAPLVVECAAQRFTDERAATSPADVSVELLDEVVIEAYVQSHGHKLAHNATHMRAASLTPEAARYPVAAISSACRSSSPAPASRSRSATLRPSASGS